MNKAVGKAQIATNDTGDRKLVLFGTLKALVKVYQWSSMPGKLIKAMNNPTIVVLTDRNDLDDQLYKTFFFIKRNTSAIS